MPFPIETTSASGVNLYAILHNPDGRVWNAVNSAWETFNAGNWAQYAIALTEQSTTGYYRAAYPAAAVDVLATVVGYLRAGGAPAITDGATGASQVQGVNVVALSENLDSAANLAASASAMVRGAVIAGTSTTTSFPTNLTGTVDNDYQSRAIMFLSGVLDGQVGNITAYDHTTAVVTVGGAFTAAPSAGDSFIIV